MNSGNFKLQEIVVETLGYIDYWDTINIALGWGVALSFIATAFTFLCALSMFAEEVKSSQKDKRVCLSIFASFALIFFVFLSALIITPTASVKHSKLTLLTSQMVLDKQACNFISSLIQSNNDFANNVMLPSECIKNKHSEE